jgi:hypothetical protein
MHKTGAPGHVYAIDTDNAWEAMRPLDGHLDRIVSPFPIHQWDDFKPAVKTIREKGTSNDWYVLDRGDVVWDAAQEGWSQKVEGEDIDEFFLKHQMSGTNPGGDYGTNWTQIKRMYQGAGINLITRFPGHVLCCVSADLIRENAGQFSDDGTVIAKYHHTGMKPSGQAKLAHLFHTELYFVESPSGFKITTAKDRKPFSGEGGREYLKGKPVTPDFVLSYLIGVAGWRP